MTGLMPSRTRIYDNAAEFAADLPTYAHRLRRLGYLTVLSGKMHFCGPDQLLSQGEPTGWDFQPFRDATHQYVRNTIALDDLEAMARFPKVK